MHYLHIKLSDDDIRQRTYTRHFGGGADQWERRGLFQLQLLRHLGLEPSHRFLDVGCGPLRSGRYFIDYLNDGQYCGVDYNPDFIRAGAAIVNGNARFSKKHPALQVINDFDFNTLDGTFDFVLAFSVLNHCPEDAQRLFFERIGAVVNPTTKIYITHARWFDRYSSPTFPLQVARKFSNASDLDPQLDMKAWGWPTKENVFPLLELSTFLP